MRYITDDGELIEGSSPTEVLMDLKNGSRFDAGRELEEYLTDLKVRLREYYGKEIAATDHGELVDAFEEIGFIAKVD